MGVRILLLLLAVGLVCPIAVFSQQPVFQQFTEQDGLPSNYLNCLFQDSRGFIWIGTDKGLVRFDGHSFQTYTTDDGLSGNMILDVAEDQQGQLWIGTFERGMCRFDGKKFECWGRDHGIATVSSLLVGDGHTIVYSSGAGKLFRFVVETKKWESLVDKELTGMASSVIALSDTAVLFPCGSQLYLVPKGEQARLLPLEDDRVPYWITKGLATAKGEIWLVDTRQGRLLQVELRPDRLEVVRTLPWSRSNASLLERDDHFVLNYQKENSFHLVDRKDGTAQTIPNPHSGQNIDMLLDSENQLWLASIGFGLWLQKGHPYLGQLPDQQGAAYDVEILPNRHILVGGNEGIWWYDENLKLRGHQSGMEQVRGVKKLRGIGICAGTLRGETYFFNNESDLARNDLSHTTVVSSGLSGLVSAGEGEVLFSSYGAGLQLFSNGKMETYDSPALPNLMVEGLFQTSQGLWATSSSDGVLLFGEDRHQLFSKQTGLTSNNIYSIFESTADSIWMGAENGATLWDGRQTFVNFTSADGLAGKRITAFFKDKYKQVWAFSDAYLHRWNGRQWTALKSLSFQKTPAGRVYDVAYDATAHRVFVAATTGAFVLSLQDAKPMGEPIDFVLESIEGKDGPLEAEELNILPAENNSIRIQYALPSFTKWEANRSCFRLLEQGEDWTEARQVSSFQFENLPSGHYTLQAFAENPDGLRSDVQTLATVKILPPIWLSWWAIALEVLLGILLLGSLIAWYFQRKNKKRLAALKIERELQTERERISRDLHDNIGAQLTNITYKLDMAAHLSKNEEDARKMERVSDETRNTMKLLRDTIWALDKDEFSFEDLAGRLQLYVNKLEGIDIAFSVRKQIETDWMISSKEVLHLFRILQEAIQNIIKHANASRAEIVFNIKAQAFEIVVMDNGKGMTNNAADGSSHYGLDNMAFRAREIGADFSTQTNRPQGTVVSIVKKK